MASSSQSPSSSSSTSTSTSSGSSSGVFSKLLLREFVNNQLEGTEPWKILVGTAGALYALNAARNVAQRRARGESFLQIFGGAAMSAIKFVPGAQAVIGAQVTELLGDLENSLTPAGDIGPPQLELPEEGIPGSELIERLSAFVETESQKWRDGKVSGSIYLGNDEHTELVNRAFALYSLTNPLHADAYPSLRKLEAEVIAMTINMLGGSLDRGHCGAITSGGTESILMALKCYRDQARADRGLDPEDLRACAQFVPEVVACVTCHAAFNKGCAYFGLKLVLVGVTADQRMDVAAARAAINSNTVLLVGSACCFSSGMIDPIEELGALAREHGIGLHVDGCLGGFVLPWIRLVNPNVPPFDLSVPGVTSMSADTHKYGYSVKGTSVLMFSTPRLRSFMYFVQTEWPGGIYASPGMAGSRSGGLVAATWTSLMALGKNRMAAVGAGIWDVVQTLKTGIPAIPGLQLLGDTQSSVVAWSSDRYNIFRIGEGMAKKGWALNNLQKPNALHLCVCAPHIGKAHRFLQDLAQSVDEVASSPSAHKGGGAHMYGMAAALPDRTIVRDMTRGFLDLLTKPVVPKPPRSPAAPSSSSQ